jgi:hypothetical protein
MNSMILVIALVGTAAGQGHSGQLFYELAKAGDSALPNYEATVTDITSKHRADIPDMSIPKGDFEIAENALRNALTPHPRGNGTETITAETLRKRRMNADLAGDAAVAMIEAHLEDPPTELCDVNEGIHLVAGTAVSFCEGFGSWMSIAEDPWTNYFKEMVSVETDENFDAKVEAAFDRKVDQTSRKVKRALEKRYGRDKIKKALKKIKKVKMAGKAIQPTVCQAATQVAKISAAVAEQCVNTMDIMVMGKSFVGSLMDSMCVLYCLGGATADLTYQAIDTIGNGNDLNTASGIHGVDVCECKTGHHTTFDPNDLSPVAGAALKQDVKFALGESRANRGQCKTYDDMVVEFQTNSPALHLVGKSEHLAHFRMGPDSCKDPASLVLLPGQLGDVYPSVMAAMPEFGIYTSTDVRDVSMLDLSMTCAYSPDCKRPEKTCGDIYVINSGDPCPTDWFYGDMVISKMTGDSGGWTWLKSLGVVVGILFFMGLVFYSQSNTTQHSTPHGFGKNSEDILEGGVVVTQVALEGLAEMKEDEEDEDEEDEDEEGEE